MCAWNWNLTDGGGGKTTEACDALVKCQYACDVLVICRSSRAPGSTNLHGALFYLWFRSRFVSLKVMWRSLVELRKCALAPN